MIDLGNSYFVLLASGIALFLFGMTTTSSSLEKLLANRITGLLNKVSGNRFLAIVTGISLTTILQSSGAVTSMLVGLGSARVITLRQVMGIIIGTAIGSTLTVQIMSFNLSQYALPLFAISFAFYFQSKKATVRNVALVFMGFSFLFIGIKMISLSAHHFAEIPMMKEFFVSMKENPIYSLVAAMLFCAAIQSSAVTVGIAMGLASANAITLYDAMLWVYGANIGTTATALIAAAGSNYVGRQVAWAHFFYKTVSVLVFYPFTDWFMLFLQQFDKSTARIVANGHFVFNIFSAVLFFPFVAKGAALIEKLFPPSSADQFGTEFVNLNNYQSSALASSYANREIMRTADIVLGMVKDSIKLFDRADQALIESIKDRDNKVDFLYREVKMFLLDHANKSPAVNQSIMSMIMYLSDLERAADAIDINIIALAIKKNALKLEFSEEGWRDICTLHEQILQVAATAINAYQTKDLCDEAIQMKRNLAKLEIQLRENHVNRLNRGMRDSINTSSIHLDLLSEYRRIGSLLCNHAYQHSKLKRID